MLGLMQTGTYCKVRQVIAQNGTERWHGTRTQGEWGRLEAAVQDGLCLGNS